jgi:tetratricopeptide (TPR) repeat protein
MKTDQDDGFLSICFISRADSVDIQKAGRKLRLLRKEIAEHGEQPRQYLHLADCYFSVKDYKQAMKYAILALDSPVQPVTFRFGLFHVAIESMRQLGWPLDEQLALANMAMAEYPDQPEFYGERGMILCAMDRLEEAKASLLKAASLYESPEAPPTAETYFCAPSAATVYARLGELEAIGENRDVAKAYFLKALAEDGENEAIREKYERFLRGLRP